MKIFLSHASEQHSEADRLAIALRARGHKVFLDHDDLPPAGDYQLRIQRAINECDLFCFLISPQSIAAGRFTLSELGFARRRWPNPMGRVLPVVVEKVPIETVPAYLRAVSILGPQGDLVADTLGSIEGLHPRTLWHSVPTWGGIGLALLLIAVSYFYLRNISVPTPKHPDQQVKAPETSQRQPASNLRIQVAEKSQETVGQFITYMKSIGFLDLDDNVTVYLYSKESPLPGDLRDQSDVVNAFYRDNALYLHWEISNNMTAVLGGYTHYVLLKTAGENLRIRNTGVENGLADYFPASFLGSPLIGEGLGGRFHLPTSCIRKLDNDLIYTAVSNKPLARGRSLGRRSVDMPADCGAGCGRQRFRTRLDGDRAIRCDIRSQQSFWRRARLLCRTSRSMPRTGDSAPPTAALEWSSMRTRL
jgi:hypothetical protein